MSFNTFCNICFVKEHIIKLCMEENESIFNILTSFTSSTDTVRGIIYLCINCCNKLEEFKKLRELFLTNFVRFRHLYNEHKKRLEIRNAPDIEMQLKTFVEVNVERPSGTPLIENYEAAQALRKYTEFNLDICNKSNNEFLKRDLDELVNKYDSSNTDLKLSSEINISENETPSYVKYENDCCNENQESIPGSSVYIKAEPNPGRFEESHDPLVSDTVTNVNPSHHSADDDISDASFNPEDSADDSTGEEGFADFENKPTSDTVCNVCDEKFLSKSDLEVHLGTHTGAKHYNCAECNQKFTDIDKLLRHERFHSSNRRYKCDECGLGFTQLYNLISHKRTHTGEKPYKCEECGMGFARLFVLKRHKLTHTGEKPYPCDECSKKFADKAALIMHKRTHTGEKPYKCDQCGRDFARREHFDTHMRIHTGEKPYKCDECGLGFARRDLLYTHKNTHTNEKPFSCDECDKTFTQIAYLKKHKRIHSGEKPYKCDECGVGFAERSNLNAHKLIHMGKKPYKCDKCDMSFRHPCRLKRHKLVHS